MHVAGARVNLPGSALRAFRRNIAAPGLTTEAALYSVSGNVSGAGMQVDVARGGFLDLNVAASRAALHGARNVARPYVARASLQLNLASEVRELHVVRPSLGVDVAARAFDGLIARAAARANDGVRGYGNLVVDGDVAHVHVVNVNAVALLPDGRTLFDLVNVSLPVAHQPMVADVDLSTDEDGSRRAGANCDVAGASEYFKIDRPVHRERLFEATLRRRGKHDHRGEKHDQRNRRHKPAGHGS